MIVDVQNDHRHYSVNSSCSICPVDQRATTGAAHGAPGCPECRWPRGLKPDSLIGGSKSVSSGLVGFVVGTVSNGG
jgi:hypothetical protein